jgi:hypothetical protein
VSVSSKLARKHEDDLAETFGGRRTPGSGNQFANQMDGRQDRYEMRKAMTWDGKATRGKSVSVTREMWEKAVEQAHGECPMLALRFYDSEVGLDLVVLTLDDFVELLEAFNGG